MTRSLVTIAWRSTLRRFLLALSLALAAVPALLSGQSATPSTRAPALEFKASVDLVALNVTVTDRLQHLVGGIGEGDFAVFEDGVRQDIEYFSAGRLPLDVSVLLDSSSSMAPILATAQQAAIGFVETTRDDDHVSVVEITDRPSVLAPATSRRAEAIAAIRRTTARGSTSLYDAIYIALSDMVKSRRTHASMRRQVIAVLSDGRDTSSVVQFDHVMELARESGVAVYAIVLVDPSETGPPMRAESIQPQFVMRELAQQTGGQWFVARGVKPLPGIYAAIASELAEQYTMGYVSSNPVRDGAFRLIQVTVPGRPGVSARTRAGYQAPRARPSSLTR